MAENEEKDILERSHLANVELPRLTSRLAEWRWLHRSWWAAHYGIGILGVAAGAITTLGDKIPIPGVYVGIVAAVSTSLVTFLGPLTKAQRYWLAFHEVDQACLEFEAGFGTKKDLTRACKKAREILTIGTGFDGGGNGESEASKAV